jgi:hypothetical protein
VPVADSGTQRPAVASLTPAANATVDSVAPTIEVAIQNRDTTVDTSTLQLTVNGTPASVGHRHPHRHRRQPVLSPLPPAALRLHQHSPW